MKFRGKEMSVKYREHKGLNLPSVAKEVLEKWKLENTFEESVSTRDENKPFVFFEGPPSANGMPGNSPRYGSRHQRYLLSVQNTKRI